MKKINELLKTLLSQNNKKDGVRRFFFFFELLPPDLAKREAVTLKVPLYSL